MKTSAEIREEMGRQYDKAQAIIDVARAANRDLTDEETATIDSINGAGDPKGKDYKPGVIDKLKADLQRAENIEAREAELNAARQSTVNAKQLPQLGDGAKPVDADSRLAKVTIPATARYRHTALKAFKGENADRAAFLAGHFLLATVGRSEASMQWCKDHGIETKYFGALKEGDNSLGGFLVPTELERAIINLREERGVLRREARVIPMGTDSMSIPRRTGGVTAYFVGENSEITASDPTWDQVQLSVKKLGALVKMSSEVSEDAVISLADYVAAEIAYSFADKEDACGFNGDGTSTYGGMVGLKNALLAGSEVTATAGNLSFGTLDLVDFHNMVAKLPLYAQQNAKWYISKAGFAASMERLMAAGGGNAWANLANGNAAPRFLGYDVVFVQTMNSTLTDQASTEGLVYFGDLRQAITMGSRRGISVMSSSDRYFELDQIGIKGTERFDVVVHERGTASAAGSVIQLITPAS